MASYFFCSKYRLKHICQRASVGSLTLARRRTCPAFLKTWMKTIQNPISCESRAFIKEEYRLFALALKNIEDEQYLYV